MEIERKRERERKRRKENEKSALFHSAPLVFVVDSNTVSAIGAGRHEEASTRV